MSIGRLFTFAIALVATTASLAVAGGEKGQLAITPLAGVDIPIQYLQQTEDGGSGKLGLAFGATGEYFLTDRLSIGGRFMYNRFGVDFANQSNPDDWDGNWVITEFGVFGRYVFQIPSQPLLHPFVRAGALFGNAALNVDHPSGLNIEDDIATSIGGDIAAGLLYDLGDFVSFYTEVTWTALATNGAEITKLYDGHDIIETDEFGNIVEPEDLKKNLQWIGLKAGISVFFGGSR